MTTVNWLRTFDFDEAPILSTATSASAPSNGIDKLCAVSYLREGPSNMIGNHVQYRILQSTCKPHKTFRLKVSYSRHSPGRFVVTEQWQEHNTWASIKANTYRSLALSTVDTLKIRYTYQMVLKVSVVPLLLIWANICCRLFRRWISLAHLVRRLPCVWLCQLMRRPLERTGQNIHSSYSSRFSSFPVLPVYTTFNTFRIVCKTRAVPSSAALTGTVVSGVISTSTASFLIAARSTISNMSFDGGKNHCFNLLERSVIVWRHLRALWSVPPFYQCFHCRARTVTRGKPFEVLLACYGRFLLAVVMHPRRLPNFPVRSIQLLLK